MTVLPEDCASRASWRYFSATVCAVPRIFTSGPFDSYERVSGFGPLRPLPFPPPLRPRIRLFCAGLIENPQVARSPSWRVRSCRSGSGSMVRYDKDPAGPDERKPAKATATSPRRMAAHLVRGRRRRAISRNMLANQTRSALSRNGETDLDHCLNAFFFAEPVFFFAEPESFFAEPASASAENALATTSRRLPKKLRLPISRNTICLGAGRQSLETRTELPRRASAVAATTIAILGHYKPGCACRQER